MTDGGESDRTAARVADLWHLYQEHATQARQHETLRATVNGTLAAIAAAVITLTGFGGLSGADFPAGLIVLLIGILGVALNVKHFERNRWHTEVMESVQREIDSLRQPEVIGARSMSEIVREARADHNRKVMARSGLFHPLSPQRKATVPPQEGASPPEEPVPPQSAASSRGQLEPRLVRMRLWVLWAFLSAGIAVIGIVMIALSIGASIG